MAWYDSVGNGLSSAYHAVADAFSGPSTNPAAYNVPFRDRNQIMGQVNSGMNTHRNMSEFRNAQMSQLNQLQGIMSGQQQGAGELAVQRQYQNQLAAQQSAARMARGPMAGLAMQGARDQMAGAGINAMGMGQQAALGDQMAAHGMAANVSQAGRGQDMQHTQMDDAQRLAYLQQLTGMNAAELQAQVGAMQAANAKPSGLGSALSSIAPIVAALAMSDERVKEGVTDARDEIDEMLDALAPKSYVYKNQQRHGIGRRVGIMAQDLERSRAGSHVVTEVADGKAIDINKAVSAALASSARLNERLRKLERKAG